MPDHVHLILTPAHDVTIERGVQLIKGGYSHALGTLTGRNSEIWQRGFTDHRIRDAQDFAHHRNYIHQNPVVAKIAIVACEFHCCSAFPGFKLDPWPPAAKAAVIKSIPVGTSGTRALPDSAVPQIRTDTRSSVVPTRALPGSAVPQIRADSSSSVLPPCAR